MFIIDHSRVFIMPALKPLSDNSHMSFISAVPSIDVLFFIQLEILLILGVMSDFLLKPENFYIIL